MELSYFYAADAPTIRAYSWQHVLYLVVCAVTIFLFIKNRAWMKTNRNQVCKTLLWILLFQQVFLLYGWYAFATGFDPAVALPLHICRVASILTIVFLLTKKMFFLDVVCYFSIFSLVSFFYPMNVYHFAHVNGLSYMVNHLITALIPLFAVIAFGWRPTWTTYRNAAIGFFVYFPLALLANGLTRTGNYFYQTDRPFLRGMPQWQFSALSFAVTLLGFAFVPFVYTAVKRIAKKR